MSLAVICEIFHVHGLNRKRNSWNFNSQQRSIFWHFTPGTSVIIIKKVFQRSDKYKLGATAYSNCILWLATLEYTGIGRHSLFLLSSNQQAWTRLRHGSRYRWVGMYCNFFLWSLFQSEHTRRYPQSSVSYCFFFVDNGCLVNLKACVSVAVSTHASIYAAGYALVGATAFFAGVAHTIGVVVIAVVYLCLKLKYLLRFRVMYQSLTT